VPTSSVSLNCSLPPIFAQYSNPKRIEKEGVPIEPIRATLRSGSPSAPGKNKVIYWSAVSSTNGMGLDCSNTCPDLTTRTDGHWGSTARSTIPHDENFYEQHYPSTPSATSALKSMIPRRARSATLICYDQMFPEAARIKCIDGAEMVFYIPRPSEPCAASTQAEGDLATGLGERDARANAIAKRQWWSRRSTVRGPRTRWILGACSFVIDAFGKTLVRAGSDEQVVTGHDRPWSTAGASGKVWRFFHNRRPDQYGKITEGR